MGETSQAATKLRRRPLVSDGKPGVSCIRTLEFAAPRKAKRHKTNFTHKDSQSRSLAIAARPRPGQSVSAVSILVARLSSLLLSLDSWMLIRCAFLRFAEQVVVTSQRLRRG